MTQPAPVGMNTAPSVFCASFELSASKWKLGFSDGARRKLATVDAKDWKAVEEEIARARQRFGIEEKAPLFSCYEAGRDGFWIHRELEKRSIRNIVMDPSSIEVSRRARRAKTDSIDAIGLVEKLVKYSVQPLIGSVPIFPHVGKCRNQTKAPRISCARVGSSAR